MTDASDDTTPPEEKGAVAELIEIIKTVAYALGIALVLRVLLFQPFTIPSASMEPNLYQGDYIIVSKFSYGWSKHSIPFSPPIIKGRILGHEPRRGDIIVFKLPRDNRTDYIKRLIGLPGDTIEMRRGQLFVNGEALDEPYVQDEYRRGLADVAPTKVDPDHYFVMGDHRNQSYDSREWGQVPRGMIKGRALLIWYSFPEENGQPAGISRQMRSWVEKAIYFPFRSRWSRCFTLIR
jgi:signal peptidase I